MGGDATAQLIQGMGHFCTIVQGKWIRQWDIPVGGDAPVQLVQGVGTLLHNMYKKVHIVQECPYDFALDTVFYFLYYLRKTITVQTMNKRSKQYSIPKRGETAGCKSSWDRAAEGSL
mgnify:CR=1 FL=1